MLANAPLDGPLTVVKPFGPDVQPDGPVQRGHLGVDVAVAVGATAGAPVRAVQAGAVLRVIDDHPAWGRVVVLGHEWGQSVYARLGSVKAVGGSVAAGQVVGVAGEGAGEAAPHLHFGLRIQPFSFEDGMAGYTDPQPYLERLTTPRGAILGPHIIGGVGPHLDLLRRWQPRLITVLDPNPDEMARLRAACPQATIVGRIFVPDSEVSARITAGPEIAAEWAHELTMQRLTPHVNYWQVANEVLAAAADLPLLARFEMRRMQLAAAMFACAIFAFSVGNPDLPQADRMGAWRLLYPALAQAEQGGHIVAVHQYGAPDLWAPFHDWYGYRLEHQVLPRLPFKRLQFAVTEYGIDGMIQGGGPHGWQSFTDAQGYADQLVRSGRYLERFSGRVLGYSVFTLGHNSPWQSYDIAGPVAERLAAAARGAWQAAEALGTGIAPGQPNPSTDPDAPPNGAPDGAPDGPQSPDPHVVLPIINPDHPQTEPTPAEPAPTEPAPSEPTPAKPARKAADIDRRLTPWFDALHLSIHSIAERPDQPAGGPTGNVVYMVKDVFTTRNGSWDVNGEQYGAVQWAKDDYVASGAFSKAYEKNTLYGAVLGLDGQFVYGQELLLWTGGLEKLTDLGNTTYTVRNGTEQPGWAIMLMGGSSSYDAAGGQSGPWCWTPNKLPAEAICGGGLPNGEPVSIFVVWQAVDQNATATPTPTPVATDPGAPTLTPTATASSTPGTPSPTTTLTPTPSPTPTPTLERRAGSWVAALNLGYVGIADRPDNPAAGDYVYLIKDIFTTRDGSWEPSSIYGGIDAWARDAYLKPLGDPEYFDDAGGDHHLFGAVLDANGKLIKAQDFLYWSDGLVLLGDPNYDGYAVGSNGYRYPRTKDRSGWANIVIDGGSSYVPARGESGPWCWTPRGLPAEVMCGGGMPAKLHISTFVVWQAVRSGQAPVAPPAGDYKLYLPNILKR